MSFVYKPPVKQQFTMYYPYLYRMCKPLLLSTVKGLTITKALLFMACYDNNNDQPNSY